MNPVLVDSIRHRMREKTTDQLLELWVTNDRVTWSPEAFEAVKSLLTERGVKALPAQNDPAPIAETHSPLRDPVARYWFGWLRPLLWIGVVLAAFGLVEQAVAALILWHNRGAAAFRVNNLRDLVLGVSATLVWPVWLMAGSLGCLRLLPGARVLLLAFAWISLIVGTFGIPYSFWVILWYRSDVFDPQQAVHVALVNARSLVLPTVLLLILRRPEIRSLFQPHAGRGFEPHAISAQK